MPAETEPLSETAALSAGAAVGQVARWLLIFAISVPLSLACVVLGVLWRPRTLAAEPAAPIGLLDLPLFGTALTTLMLFLMNPAVRLRSSRSTSSPPQTASPR
ncbi:hypothetical protein DSC45_29505 [Streptomyces sp. YIM 130001]|uniref:hypothetical protein n=1 Tax=Streptomyces sp. YIM 130001 TaxID=2259644 RepID=UPI000EE532CB|nr:hypothetical protein [Streptomyces sp. YIM 130001]RII09644.1 hypothetical protein DSC45_29505 [Streptomyces sp. YIM 130001]